MDFSVDSHFVIGKSHIKQNKPCQDHSLSKLLSNGCAIAVISDGCSSGDNTDIGARILTCSAIKAVESCFNVRNDISDERLPMFIHDTLMLIVEEVQKLLNRNYRDFLATCVYSVINAEGGFIHMLGDGCASVKFNNGAILFVRTEWQNNMPFYPIYSGENKERFISEHLQVENGAKAMKISQCLIDVDGEFTTEDDTYLDIYQALNGYIIPILKHNIDKIQSVCIFSDGIEDFRIVDDKNIATKQDPTPEIIQRLLAIKTFGGEFVKRTLSRALTDLSKMNINAYDDFSMAATHVKQSESK